jgi:hypothetical protein
MNEAHLVDPETTFDNRESSPPRINIDAMSVTTIDSNLQPPANITSSLLIVPTNRIEFTDQEGKIRHETENLNLVDDRTRIPKE